MMGADVWPNSALVQLLWTLSWFSNLLSPQPALPTWETPCQGGGIVLCNIVMRYKHPIIRSLNQKAYCFSWQPQKLK